MSDPLIIAIAAAVGGLSWYLTGRIRSALLRHRLLDHPNERSSHTEATPRGGGLAVLIVLLPVWVVLAYLAPAEFRAAGVAPWLVPVCALLLATISFLDDIRGLSQGVRFIAQAVVVGACVGFLPGPVFQGLLGPLPDAILAAIVWLWFVNLFNFMDGIDGIAGVEAIAIGVGLYLIGAALAAQSAGYAQALALAAAMTGFLLWNWHPARIFLGDVGSVPIGLLLGWLLLELAATGLWHAALILPLYYLADATLTLVRRLLRGAPVWRAHREHCYQIAVQRGRPHATVSGAVALTNAALVGCAFVAALPLNHPVIAWLMLVVAGLLVAGLMLWMVAGTAPPASARS